jgi:hypothetical protein
VRGEYRLSGFLLLSSRTRFRYRPHCGSTAVASPLAAPASARSLAELAARGHLTAHGKPYVAPRFQRTGGHLWGSAGLLVRNGRIFAPRGTD